MGSIVEGLSRSMSARTVKNTVTRAFTFPGVALLPRSLEDRRRGGDILVMTPIPYACVSINLLIALVNCNYRARSLWSVEWSGEVRRLLTFLLLFTRRYCLQCEALRKRANSASSCDYTSASSKPPRSLVVIHRDEFHPSFFSALEKVFKHRNKTKE